MERLRRSTSLALINLSSSSCLIHVPESICTPTVLAFYRARLARRLAFVLRWLMHIECIAGKEKSNGKLCISPPLGQIGLLELLGVSCEIESKAERGIRNMSDDDMCSVGCPIRKEPFIYAATRVRTATCRRRAKIQSLLCSRRLYRSTGTRTLKIRPGNAHSSRR